MDMSISVFWAAKAKGFEHQIWKCQDLPSAAGVASVGAALTPS